MNQFTVSLIVALLNSVLANLIKLFYPSYQLYYHGLHVRSRNNDPQECHIQTIIGLRVDKHNLLCIISLILTNYVRCYYMKAAKTDVAWKRKISINLLPVPYGKVIDIIFNETIQYFNQSFYSHGEWNGLITPLLTHMSTNAKGCNWIAYVSMVLPKKLDIRNIIPCIDVG